MNLDEIKELSCNLLGRIFELGIESASAGLEALVIFERGFWESVNSYNEEKFKNSSSRTYWYEKVKLISGGEVEVLYFSEVEPENFVRPCCGRPETCGGK